MTTVGINVILNLSVLGTCIILQWILNSSGQISAEKEPPADTDTQWSYVNGNDTKEMGISTFG